MMICVTYAAPLIFNLRKCQLSESAFNRYENTLSIFFSLFDELGSSIQQLLFKYSTHTCKNS